METSPSTHDLDRAIQELDGMYHDLRRRSQVEGHLATSNPPMFNMEDEDYAVPRPAGGFMNSMPMQDESKPAPSLSTFGKVKPSHEDDTLLTSLLDSNRPRPKSPTHSSRSEQSSGFGTLPHPRGSAMVAMPEIDFPGPPTSKPPPPTGAQRNISSDSDYDEVPRSDSDLSDNMRLRHQIKEQSYTIVNPALYPQLNVDVIKIDNRKASHGSDDYDEVYDHPSNQHGSVPNIPIVVEMKKIEYKSTTLGRDNMLKNNKPIEEHSFSTPNVQVEPVKSRQHDLKDTTDDVTNASHPVDENGNVVDSSRSNIEKANSTIEISEVTPYSPRSYRSAAGGTMDSEKQKSIFKKGDDCPCECRYAVPLMSVAVIICIIALMFMIIGYVYIGLNNDEYLAKTREEINNSLNNVSDFSGEGST